MIIIDSSGGLGNRIQAIDAALSLAINTHHKLIVPWVVNAQLGCRADQLFDLSLMPAEFVYFDSSRDKNKYLSKFSFDEIHDQSTIPWSKKGYIDFYKRFSNRKRISLLNCLYISTWQHFYPSKRPYSCFHPQKEILGAILNVCSQYDQTAGVHIRRTDHRHACRHSKVDYFMAAMEHLVSMKIANTFFVASDNERMKCLLRKNFDIITYNGMMGRSTKHGMSTAVIDLWSLARTKLLLGSAGSTFSSSAARLGNIPKVSIYRSEAVQAKIGLLYLRYYYHHMLRLLGLKDARSSYGE